MRCKRRYMHGKKLRRSPVKNNLDFNTSISDSASRGNINSNVRILSDKEVEDKKNFEAGIKQYVPGVDGPATVGGAVPFGGGRILGGLRGVYNLGKKLF